MSFFDDINTGISEAISTMGESFALSNHGGTFRGVFRGENSPTEFDKLQGYDTKTTDALSVSQSAFEPGSPPMINEQLTKANGDRFIITMVEKGDDSTWDIEISKRDE